MSSTDARLSSGRYGGGLVLRSRGYSLVELLVSLCILGVLASLAAPYLGPMFQNYQLQTTARQLVTDLQFAKMRAVAQKVEYEVTFDGANKSYSIKMGDSSLGSANWTLTGISRRLSDSTNPYYAKGITFAENFTGDKVIFSPTGQTSVTGTATATFTSPSNGTTRVTVTAAGGIYVQ